MISGMKAYYVIVQLSRISKLWISEAILIHPCGKKIPLSTVNLCVELMLGFSICISKISNYPLNEDLSGSGPNGFI